LTSKKQEISVDFERISKVLMAATKKGN
jgi:hypothetical protein